MLGAHSGNVYGLLCCGAILFAGIRAARSQASMLITSYRDREAAKTACKIVLENVMGTIRATQPGSIRDSGMRRGRARQKNRKRKYESKHSVIK
jgi:hypothetical protein